MSAAYSLPNRHYTNAGQNSQSGCVISSSFPSPREGDFGEQIIGSSHAFQSFLREVRTVAPTDSAVLIQGETGTGKELIAQAIHNLSSRRNAPFVTLNCAAIPAGLLESELFGHERGAFTGALSSQVGRFQLADKGTIFLDEIGELPLELQPKLLRALQEQEFERLGGVRKIRIDVRIIAATNQDLLRMVQEHRFRADLYYRLNVFPLTLPPLRARADDIPALVEHFVRKFSKQMSRQIETIPLEVTEILKQHDWPGNIRELQNFIERSVILSTGPVLRPPLAELKRVSKQTSSANARTLAEAERDHILEVLRETRWVLGGTEGAASRLGLPRTTLVYRMKKLGIPREKSAKRPRSNASSLPSLADAFPNNEAGPPFAGRHPTELDDNVPAFASAS
jgi:formate hydrogenlyase transcriptional activator